MELATVLAACNAADQLANLAGDCEVCRILRWEGEPPQTLKGFGMERFLRGAAVLRDRVKEIRAQKAARPAPRASGGIRPRATLSLPGRTAPQATLHVPAAPLPEPFDTARALRARIEGARVEAVRLRSMGARQLLKRALAVATEDQALRLVQEVDRMISGAVREDKEAERWRSHLTELARENMASLARDAGLGRSSTKRQAQLARKQARTPPARGGGGGGKKEGKGKKK